MLLIDNIKEKREKFRKIVGYEKQFKIYTDKVFKADEDFDNLYNLIFRKCVSKTIVEDREMARERGNDTQYALLKDTFGYKVRYNHNCSSGDFWNLKKELLNNGDDVRKFILDTVGKKNYDKIKTFLDGIKDIKEFTEIEVEREINKEIYTQADMDLEYNSFNRELLDENYGERALMKKTLIPILKINQSGTLWALSPDGTNIRDFNLVLRKLKCFIFYEQIYDDVCGLCEVMIKELKSKSEEYQQKCEDLKLELSPYLIIDKL